MTNWVKHELTTTFANPFDERLNSDRLHNLFSGSPGNEYIAQNLLSVSQTGVDLLEGFQSRLHKSNAPNPLKFFTPIKKMVYQTFNNPAVKAKT